MTYSTPAPADPPIWNPDFGVINGVNQITTLVAGVDERIKGSKLEDKYWIGQYFRGQDGSIDYDLYYLYTGLDVNYAASEYLNNWSDITFADVRYADSIYESLTLKQQQNVDWVRGLAIQLGYFNMFCILK